MAHTLSEPKGPMWVDGTPLLAGLVEKVLSQATPEQMKAPITRDRKGIPIGGKETFWSMNVAANQPFQLRAVLRKISKHSYMYVQEGYEVDDATLEKLARQFDDQILPTNHKYFGKEISPGLDGDERITLLFMDIMDGWEPGKGYVAGYFFPLDHFSTNLFPQSNEREMFYLDINPGDPKRDDYMGILAHEFQHMIHFNADPKEPKWINESLAQIAFFVNGYGHAPQIFSYIRDTNSTFDAFENRLEDYGRSYLWTYYLISKYGGSTPEQQAAFIKDLVQSKKQGQESIADVLQKYGVQKPLEQIKAEWYLANVMNPGAPAGSDFGYDDSIRFAVQSAKAYATRELPAGAQEDVVVKDAAKYITVDSKIRYTPDHPTMVDKVKICSDAPGNIIWTVNGGQMPPARLIPEGSTTTQEQAVSTPLVKDGCSYSAVFGPFARLGTVIKSIDYRVPDSDKTFEVPIFSLASVASATQKASKQFKFQFEGDKKAKFVIKAIQFNADNTVRTADVPLTNNKGEITCTVAEGRVTFMVYAAEADKKKGAKFSYTLEPVAPAAVDAAGLVTAGARLAALDATIAGDVQKDAEAREAYGQILKAREENLAALANKLAKDEKAGAQCADLVANATAEQKPAYNEVLKSALKRARYEALDGNQVSEAVKAAVLSAPAKGDNEDDSHDNIRYLINKKNENIHNLTHLKIDPQFIEGQILQLWKLLELIRGFPHLPIPDGFGIVDYNEQKAKDLLGQWAADFNVPNTGNPPPAARPVAKADLEQVKLVMRRLILAESLIEFAYNNSMILADDIALSVFDFVRLLLAGHSTISDIAKNFERVPIVGPVAKALKKRILGKLLGLGEKFAVYLSARIKPPYGNFAPLVISVVVNVAARVLDVNIDRDNPGFWKELGVRLFGRYAMVSIPKVGFVARSQYTVDLATDYAANLTANGTLEEATKKVWDDESSDTESSVREVIGANVAKRHKLTAKEREIASVAKRVAQILAYASLLDPTNITKVLSIVSAVAAGGALAHATWNNASYYFVLPKQAMADGVRFAYDPAAAASTASTEKFLTAKMNVAFNNKLLGEMKAAYENYQQLAREALAEAEAKGANLARKVDALIAADAKLDVYASKIESISLAGGMLADKGDEDAVQVYAAAQTETLRRANVLADVLVRVAGSRPGASAALQVGPDKYLGALGASLNKWAASNEEVAAAACVSRSEIDEKGSELVITAVVSNLSTKSIPNVDVSLMSGMDFAVTDGAAVKRIANLPAGDEREVTFRIKLNETKKILAPQVAIVAEAQGVTILPKLQTLEP